MKAILFNLLEIRFQIKKLHLEMHSLPHNA